MPEIDAQLIFATLEICTENVDFACFDSRLHVDCSFSAYFAAQSVLSSHERVDLHFDQS